MAPCRTAFCSYVCFGWKADIRPFPVSSPLRRRPHLLDRQQAIHDDHIWPVIGHHTHQRICGAPTDQIDPKALSPLSLGLSAPLVVSPSPIKVILRPTSVRTRRAPFWTEASVMFTGSKHPGTPPSLRRLQLVAFVDRWVDVYLCMLDSFFAVRARPNADVLQSESNNHPIGPALISVCRNMSRRLACRQQEYCACGEGAPLHLCSFAQLNSSFNCMHPRQDRGGLASDELMSAMGRFPPRPFWVEGGRYRLGFFDEANHSSPCRCNDNIAAGAPRMKPPKNRNTPQPPLPRVGCHHGSVQQKRHAAPHVQRITSS